MLCKNNYTAVEITAKKNRHLSNCST